MLPGDLHLQSRTDAAGHYRITGIPPLHQQHAPYVLRTDTPGWTTGDASVAKIDPGQTLTADFQIQPAGTILGRVLGPQGNPVPNALVAADARDSSAYAHHWQTVHTDTLGRFVISAGGQDSVALVAFSNTAGTTRLQLEPVSPGQIIRRDLTLPGTLHLAGIVTDDAGTPLKDIAILTNSASQASAITKPDGRFDLGLISRQPSGPPVLLFRAPRPYRDWGTNYTATGVTYDPKDWKTPPTFYYHQQLTLSPDLDPTHLKITLHPTELLTFSGTVVDAAGKPMDHVGVLLFPGNATEDSLLAQMGVRPFSASWAIDPSAPVLCGAPWTGPNGKWTLLTVRENGTGAGGTPQTNWSSFCIGAAVDTQAPNTIPRRHTLFQNIQPTQSGKQDFIINLDK
jgi:hypothetical protein